MTPSTQALVREGKLIEAGWIELQETMPPSSWQWRNDMRTAYFAGAQHVFQSIVSAARDQDANRGLQLSAMDRELRQFMNEHLLRNAPVAGSA
jgi:hypothetical protein